MADFEGKLNLDVEASEIEMNGKFILTDEELERVSGGHGPTSDPDEPSHYRVVNLFTCQSCEWRGMDYVENGVPSICPACGAAGEVVVHFTDTVSDDEGWSFLSSYWLR